MKRTIVVAVALAFVLLSAGVALAGIADSKHDMRTHMSTAATGGYNEVCVYCHTPHSASTQAQLWNHSVTTTPTYTVYGSATMNSTVGQPGSGSLLCLGCHDGTVAVDSMVNSPNAGAVGTFGGAVDSGTKRITSLGGNFGLDLSNDHPVGMPYTDVIAGQDGYLNTVASLGTTSVRLISGQVECATCHDAHNTINATFLRSTNVGSAMCLVCHNK
jgi:predicted CXXCH cytochrome family protein